MAVSIRLRETHRGEAGRKTWRKLLSGEAIFPRRSAEFGPEGPGEIRQGIEADVWRDMCHGRSGVGEPRGRLTQARAQQPLMRRDSGHGTERAQEMVWAHARHAGEARELVWRRAMGCHIAQHACQPPMMLHGRWAAPRTAREPERRGGELERNLFHDLRAAQTLPR